MFIESAPAIENTLKPKSQLRPNWQQRHRGMTWRDMPSQSETGVTSRKLFFALYRMDALLHEEEAFVNNRRRSLGLS